MSEEWDLIESVEEKTMEGEEVITDICLLAKKERAPSDYLVLEQTVDGKKADFAEGMFGSTRRYLAYTRKVPSALRGRIVIVDLKVVNASDRAPLGFLPLTHTHDDNTKAFSSKVLVIKVGPHEQTTRGVTELQILSAGRKEDVPSGFTRLPDINGFSICYKMGDVGKRRNSQASAQKPKASEPKQEGPVRQPSVVKNFRSATDGLQFKLGPMMDTKRYLVEHALGDLKLLTLEDVDKYTVDFSKFHSIANPTS